MNTSARLYGMEITIHRKRLKCKICDITTFRAESDKEALKREADDAKAAMDALSRDKVSPDTHTDTHAYS